MAYINVDEVYILDNTGAQVDAVTDIPFKADAGLTDAQKAQARANLGISAGGGGGTNPNLLDNPWFTINQRGQNSYTTASFGVDRWTFSNSDSNHTITINADKSVTINGLFYQKKEYYLQVGEAVTISYMTADGNIVSRTGTIPASQGFAVGSSDFGLYWRTTGVADFQIWATNLNLRAVKLEKGTVSTLANDVPPDYAEELAKCQRYFVRVPVSQNQPCAFGYAHNATSIRFALPIPVPMRAVPTMATSGSFSCYGNGSTLTATALAANASHLPVSYENIAATVSGATSYQGYSLVCTTSGGGYIDLSADL